MKLCKYSRLIALAVAGTIATVSIGAITQPKQQEDKQEIVYIVQSGDSLWQIANNFKTDEEDIREFIHHMKQENPQLVEKYIQPGQKLKINIKKELADTAISANSQKNFFEN